jgi:hypothetical protein
MTADDVLRRIAYRQAGLFTRSQASECGFSPYQIRRRINAGAWQVLIASVLALAGVPITPQVRDRAAQLAVPRSVLGGPSAARWWGVAVPDLGTYLFVGAHHGPRTLTGVRLLHDPLRRGGRAPGPSPSAGLDHEGGAGPTGTRAPAAWVRPDSSPWCG